MIMFTDKRQKQKERGLASFLVTLIMMLVISLVVLGFVQLANREERESLDNQLSTAAYYAAESGVNDAVKSIKDGQLTSAKTFCQPDNTKPDLANNKVGNNSSYTCLLINPNPSKLQYQDVSQSQSTIATLNTIGGTPPSNPTALTIKWQNLTGQTSNYTGCPAVGKFPPTSSWNSSSCGAGILRIDLVPQNQLAQGSSLQNYTYTDFLVPHNGGSCGFGFGCTTLPAYTPTGIVAGANGKILPAACSVTSCSETFTNVNSGTTTWYLRMLSIYSDSSVTINANQGATPLNFKNGQIAIDSTGKANDVLKRVLVYLSYNTSIANAPFVLQTTSSLCKHYYVQDQNDVPHAVSPGNIDPSSCIGN